MSITKVVALTIVLPIVGSAQPTPQTKHADHTVLRALDADSDQSLSHDEVARAPERLRTLDRDGDGKLSNAEMGGRGSLPLRIQVIIRAMDEDGDVALSAQEIEHASAALRRLDRNGDWTLGPDDLDPPQGPGPPPPPTPANPFPLEELSGAIVPGQDDRAFDGYTLHHEASYGGDVYMARRIYLADPEGKKVHEWPVEPDHLPEGSVAYLLENGLLLRTVSKRDWLELAGFPVGATGAVQLVNWDGKVVWEFVLDVAGKHVFHHDVVAMPNGNILAIAYHGFSRQELMSMGWDGVYPKGDVIWMDKLLELKPNLDDGSTEIIWQWNSWDHLVQDKFEDRPNYGDVSKQRGKLDVNYLRDGMVAFNAGQMLHMNSVDYNAELDQIALSLPTFGEVWILDHSVTMAEAAGDKGDLIYRYGNPAATKSGEVNDAILYWQHDVHWVDDGLKGAGNIMVYNNGNHRRMDGTYFMHQPLLGFGTAYSDLLELEMPLEADGSYDWSKEAKVTWSWNRDGGEDYYSPFMSGLSRLPNGNVIFVSAPDKRIIEVTDSGERVEDYRRPGNGRMYRVYKYAKDYPGLKGKL